MKKRKSKRENVVENEDVGVKDDTSKELQKLSCRMSPKSMYMAVKGMSYTQKEMLAYADKVVLNGYNIRRSRPLIKQIDSVDLEMLEEHGLRMGKFGTLEFRGDGEVDLIDVNDDQDKLVGVETIEMLYCRICDDKKKIEEAIKKGLENDGNDDEVKEWSRKVSQLFNATTVEHGDNSSPKNEANEATMKTPVKVAVNSEQSNFVKGSSPICNVQSSVENNEKTKVVDGCDSPSVLFLEYKGNTSLDSPVVLTPGFLNMSDEIVERSMRRKKDFCKDDIPSFDLRITQLNDEDKNMDDNEGSKRKGKLGQLVCSPYVDRITDVDEAVKDDENVVAQSIIVWGKDKGEIIWETIEGHGMHLESAHTLAMRTKVHTNVIDTWAAFHNKAEELKSEASYSRMYFTCDTITEYMVNEAVDEELRYNKFKIMFVAVINDISDKPDLKTVDLVFIPVVVDDNYYLVCFCLKRVAFYIFDHIKRSGTIESAYGNRPRILQTFVKHYAAIKKMDRFERMKLIEEKKKEITGVV
ncbi:unnamed protein product [Lactuca virosa]|uniref:Ubiquitin-like protease family profile domain-containing protein n=1 Tax=Lactuca virosa TaxID=75947 RepID=A0AAU9NQA9_9ASTR|nr:unnamed protein product [Lactuca virosa]